MSLLPVASGKDSRQWEAPLQLPPTARISRAASAKLPRQCAGVHGARCGQCLQHPLMHPPRSGECAGDASRADHRGMGILIRPTWKSSRCPIRRWSTRASASSSTGSRSARTCSAVRSTAPCAGRCLHLFPPRHVHRAGRLHRALSRGPVGHAEPGRPADGGGGLLPLGRLLRAFSALKAYREVYSGIIEPRRVAELRPAPRHAALAVRCTASARHPARLRANAACTRLSEQINERLQRNRIDGILRSACRASSAASSPATTSCTA